MSRELDKLPKTIRLTITTAHVEHGVRRNCRYCPTGLALLEWLRRRGLPFDIEVGAYNSYLWEADAGGTSANHWSRPPKASYHHPERLQEQIDAFDDGGSFKPGRYQLRRNGE